nr:Endoglin CD105 antigen domain containing protein [Haemonchus contortus]
MKAQWRALSEMDRWRILGLFHECSFHLFSLLTDMTTQYNATLYISPDISAMCSSQGITSSIVFDGPFSGKIYSPDYATVRECIYYDGQNQENVLFSIPVHRCGTRLTRTSRNLVDQMESRVYVQMEHEAQTALDQQFLFVCQLAGAKAEGSSIRRHPVAPSSGSDSYATAPEAIKPSQFRVSTHLRPVQGVTIPRVSAFSVDGHFGNWPIPGARPYSASIAPVASWPRLPLPDPIVPQSQSAPPLAAAADLPAKVQGLDGYAISPALRSDTQSVQKPNIFPEPVKTAASPPGVLRSLSVTQVAQKSAEPQTGLYVTPEEPRIGTEAGQSTTESATSLHRNPPTQIPAYPWNKPYPGSPLQPEFTGNSLNESYPAVVDQVTNHRFEKAKIFKEEQPRVDVDFKTDTDEKVLSSDGMVTSRLVSTQEYHAPTELSLEVQQGNGPFAPAVNSPLKIGDNITLVVRSKSQMTGSQEYDMFVHSCFASNGQGNEKIDLIDENGCASHPQFASPLNRTKDPSGIMYYFFRITAFKFPGPNDVYFSCSIEMTPFRDAPEICPLHRRNPRDVSQSSGLRLFDSVEVELAVEQMDPKKERQSSSESSSDVCFSKSVVLLSAAIMAVLLFTTVAMSFVSITLYLKISTQNRQKTPYPIYRS